MTKAASVRVAILGLGPIGQGIARLLAETPGFEIVGAADPMPGTGGKDLGTVLGLPRRLKVKVEADPGRLARSLRADVAVLSTSSIAKEVKDDVLALVARGASVVTTCEELAFPTPERASVVKEIEKAALKKGVRVLGTGVNPGFAMDILALALTAACQKVERISVTRVVDAASRRLPLQRKVGAGLNIAQFRRAVTEHAVRHVGLVESTHMIATTLGWTLDRIEETVEPAVAPRDLDTEFLRIPAGAVAGIRQTLRGYRNGIAAISLELQLYVGAESPRDHIVVDGFPPIDMTIAGGIAGDSATAALVVNSIPKLLRSRTGFLTMRDLPFVHALNPRELRERPRKG